MASDGTIYVAGSYLSGSGSAAQIWAFKDDGSVETAFASGAYFDTVSSYVNGYSVIEDSNNKIVMGGYKEWGGRDDPTFWRLDSTGAPDATFSSDGISHVGISGVEVEAAKVVEDTVNGGYFAVGGQYHNYLVISKSDSVGGAETDFGGTGTVTFNTINRCLGRDVVVDSLGRAVVAGSCSPTNDSGNYDMFVWRFNADGSLDTTFDGDGYFTQSGTAGGGSDYDEEAFGLFLDGDGDIYVTGRSHNGTDYDMVVWKLKASDGTLDTTFSSDGYLYLNDSGGALGNELGRSIILDSTGKILVAGNCYNSSGNLDACIWKFDSTGALDSSFDEDGVFQADNIAGGNGDDTAWGIALDATERVLISGSSYDSSVNQVFVLRLK